MKTLYLIDVSSMFFRAFYAIRPLTSPAGVPVNAVYGFLSMMGKLIKSEKPQYMLFAYDRKEPSFRKDMYTEYKAHRSEMPEDLAQQIPYIKRLADLLGIASLEVAGFEADDIIGAMTHLGRHWGFNVVIVSGDKDFGQLVGPGVTLYDTMKEVRYDAAGVKEKWGIAPEHVIDYLALVGDSSDNIPGVAGIGPKGAVKLLEQFPTLEAIYENIDQVESKSVREKLLASKDNAFLSKQLVTIVTEMDIPKESEHYRLKPLQREELRALLNELNFRALEKTLLGSENESAGTAPSTVSAGTVGTNEGTVATAASGDGAVLAPQQLSFETQALPMEPRSVQDLEGILASGAELWGFDDSRGVFLSDEKIIYAVEGELTGLGEVTDRLSVQWKGFDLKKFWARIGADKPLAVWDAMLAAYSVEPKDWTDPAKVLKEHLDVSLPEFASPSQWLAAQNSLREVLENKLRERQVEKIYREFELPLAAVLFRMEKKGIRIDREQLKIQSDELAGEIQVVEKEIHTMADESFNVGSPKQLGHILFEKLGLETGKKTKTGYSTDTDVLEGLSHPIAAKVILWRELSKLKSTYVDALPRLAREGDRVHTTFNQALTATGRLSSTEPNLQNIPIRTPRGQRVRRAFVAAPGLKLLSVDYSQIELRILAHISEDPGLRRAFHENLDIHMATAAEVFQVPLRSITAEQRRIAKAVNFGIAYGQGAFGLAEVLGIPRGEAQNIIKRYFEKFKGVEDYIQSTIKTAHERGYVETLFGRRRYIPELASKNGALRKFGERAAINAPIQGTASDLVKLAMIRLAETVPVPMLLQVHDELIFEDTDAELQKWQPQILELMEGVTKLSVPLRANAAIGNNWDEAH